MRRFLAIVATGVLLAGCNSVTTPPTQAQQAQDAARAKAANHQVYVPKNDIELKNYNARQEISDDPTTILWCTSSFNTPNSPLFTVPIVGKLTSGSKRPYSTSQVMNTYEYSSTYSPELPGPDGMYGPSEDYRYGFSPTGVYSEFYNLPTYCTTEPKVWQTQTTKIVLASDPSLLAAQEQAQALIKAGKGAEAEHVLETAIGQVGK